MFYRFIGIVLFIIGMVLMVISSTDELREPYTLAYREEQQLHQRGAMTAFGAAGLLLFADMLI